MANNRGKEFEAKFKSDFSLIPGVTIDRLYDPVGGYKHITNVSDFIAYAFPFIFYLECKSIQGNTFPLANLTQFDDLIAKKDVLGALAGAVIWFIDHKQVVWVSIEEFERLRNEGYKSVNIKMVDDPNFNVIKIPGIIKRIHIDADYSILITEAEKKLKKQLEESNYGEQGLLSVCRQIRQR